MCARGGCILQAFVHVSQTLDPGASNVKHVPTEVIRAGKGISSCVHVAKYSLHFMGPGGVVDTTDHLQGCISSMGLTMNVPNMAGSPSIFAITYVK